MAHGQLGTGDESERPGPRPLRSLPSNNIRAQLVACGSMHSVCVDQHGVAWTWGANAHGQLGTGDHGKRLEPTRISCDGQRVSSIAAGASHTLFCTSRGRAFACGSNEHGQCGGGRADSFGQIQYLKDEHDNPYGKSLSPSTEALSGFSPTRPTTADAAKLEPTAIVELVGVRLVMVAAGFSHSLFLSRPGGILSCGNGESGQCGNGLTNAVNMPASAVLGPLETIAAKFICTGNFHSAALAREDGAVYTWGDGRYGRLGHGPSTSNEVVPRVISGLLEVKVGKIACGGACTACVDDDGGLWTWGSNETWGQCGHGGGGSWQQWQEQ